MSETQNPIRHSSEEAQRAQDAFAVFQDDPAAIQDDPAELKALIEGLDSDSAALVRLTYYSTTMSQEDKVKYYEYIRANAKKSSGGGRASYAPPSEEEIPTTPLKDLKDGLSYLKGQLTSALKAGDKSKADGLFRKLVAYSVPCLMRAESALHQPNAPSQPESGDDEVVSLGPADEEASQDAEAPKTAASIIRSVQSFFRKHGTFVDENGVTTVNARLLNSVVERAKEHITDTTDARVRVSLALLVRTAFATPTFAFCSCATDMFVTIVALVHNNRHLSTELLDNLRAVLQEYTAKVASVQAPDFGKACEEALSLFQYFALIQKTHKDEFRKQGLARACLDLKGQVMARFQSDNARFATEAALVSRKPVRYAIGLMDEVLHAQAKPRRASPKDKAADSSEKAASSQDEAADSSEKAASSQDEAADSSVLGKRTAEEAASSQDNDVQDEKSDDSSLGDEDMQLANQSDPAATVQNPSVSDMKTAEMAPLTPTRRSKRLANDTATSR